MATKAPPAPTAENLVPPMDPADKIKQLREQIAAETESVKAKLDRELAAAAETIRLLESLGFKHPQTEEQFRQSMEVISAVPQPELPMTPQTTNKEPGGRKSWPECSVAAAVEFAKANDGKLNNGKFIEHFGTNWNNFKKFNKTALENVFSTSKDGVSVIWKLK